MADKQHSQQTFNKGQALYKIKTNKKVALLKVTNKQTFNGTILSLYVIPQNIFQNKKGLTYLYQICTKIAHCFKYWFHSRLI